MSTLCPPFFRILIIPVLILTWMIAVNHCALAAWSSKVSADNQACPCQTESAATPCAGPQMQCGDDLNSPIPPSLSAPAPDFLLIKEAWSDFDVHAQLPVEIIRLDLRWRGPPLSSAFRDFFLDRRLLAHAPPVVNA